GILGYPVPAPVYDSGKGAYSEWLSLLRNRGFCEPRVAINHDGVWLFAQSRASHIQRQQEECWFQSRQQNCEAFESFLQLVPQAFEAQWRLNGNRTWCDRFVLIRLKPGEQEGSAAGKGLASGPSSIYSL